MSRSNRMLRRPFALLAVLCSAATAPAQTPPAHEADAKLPSAVEVIARYVAALGGESVIRAHRSMSARGTFEMPSMGLAGELELASAAPNRALLRLVIAGIGEIAQGFDGEVAWSEDPMTGPTLIEGQARAEVARQSDFYPELNYAQTYSQLETVAREDRDGLPAYKLRGVDSAGKESFHYFAIDSGLLVGSEGEQDTPLGRVFVVSSVGGYESHGGRLVPTELTQKLMGMEQRMRITEIEFNRVTPAGLALPPSIQALLELSP